MKSLLYNLLILLFTCCSLNLSGTTYFLDFTNGSNSNNGLSTNFAWKDLFKIRGVTPEPSDTFLFKRGERWDGLQLYITASGNSEMPIYYGAYGNENDPLPIISLTATLPQSEIPQNWIAETPNKWKLTLAKTPSRLFLDDVEVLRASTLDFLGQDDSQGLLGKWFYDSETNHLYIYTSQNPANLYSEITGGVNNSNHIDAVLASQADYFIMENLDIRGGSRAALSLFGCQQVEIRNCQIGHSANSGVTIISSKNSGNEAKISSHIFIKNNIINSNFKFFHGLGTERGCGDGIKLFDGVTNSEIANNTFINWAHNAIELLAVLNDYTGVNDNKIYDNYISAPDIPYSHPLGADGSFGKCQNNEFYRNTIENCRTTSQINGNNNHVHHNIIKNIRNSPAKDEPVGFAFTLSVYGPTLVSQNNRFEHNLIINSEEAAFRLVGFGHPNITQGHILRNNIFYETSLAPHNNSYNQGTGILIYRNNGVGGNIYENNLFYSSQVAAKAVYQQDNTSYHSATEFNALNGIDNNTIHNNLSGNPLFTDISTNNYQLLEPSPSVNAGIDLGLTLDFALNPRVVGVTSDIGPYESTFIACPTNRVLNQSSILSYTYVAQNKIESNGTIQATENVVMKAGSIQFNSGFEVKTGGILHAYIETCSPAVSQKIKVASKFKTLTSQILENNRLQITPNPVHAISTVSFYLDKAQDAHLFLFDINGQSKWQATNLALNKGWHEQTLTLMEFPAGIYFLTLQTKKQIVTQRLLKH